ncbi:Imm49 family immunity protein [Enterovibrio norvegicus]|uniref:Imm49 family immunity protein n=1 Tax=Enterovibrio norvegicus TaxID=188144 RepID=UPI001FD0ADD7|nr:Imm49 family immunity protein [Enterovibrio norvegicus]
MKTIASHVKNLAGQHRVYDSRLRSIVSSTSFFMENMSEDRFNFEAIANHELDAFCLGVYLDDIPRETVIEHLNNAQYFTTMMHKRNMVPEDEIFPFAYGGRDFNLPGTQGKAVNSAYEWLGDVELSIVTGRFNDLNDMMALEECNQLLFRSKQTELGTYLRLHSLGLKVAQDPTALLDAFMAEVDANSALPGKKVLALGGITITLGFYDVMRAIREQDEAKYRETMYKAVEMHKEWFTHDEDFSSRMIGYVSLPLLTAAKFAYAKYGFTLDFETPYLPIYVFTEQPEGAQV